MCSTCCSYTETATGRAMASPASTCGTFTTWPAAITAWPCPTASSSSPCRKPSSGKGRARGRHRRRREPRPCFGERLHLDGSRHPWLPVPRRAATLIAILADATKRHLYAQLRSAESTLAVMSALREVFQTSGLPIALYTDRGLGLRHPRACGKVNLARPTQLGRALRQLGIEHILSYSPQARGRSERLNRTLQGLRQRALPSRAAAPWRCSSEPTRGARAPPTGSFLRVYDPPSPRKYDLRERSRGPPGRRRGSGAHGLRA